MNCIYPDERIPCLVGQHHGDRIVDLGRNVAVVPAHSAVHGVAPGCSVVVVVHGVVDLGHTVVAEHAVGVVDFGQNFVVAAAAVAL